MIVQRYFLRADTNAGNEPNQPLALACEAGFYALTDNVVQVEGAPSQKLGTATFGSSVGQIIMKLWIILEFCSVWRMIPVFVISLSRIIWILPQALALKVFYRYSFWCFGSFGTASQP